MSAEDQEFRDRLRNFLADVVTDEVIRRDRETGENFDEGVHLALGAQGYLADDFNDEADGGFGALRRRIWEWRSVGPTRRGSTRALRRWSRG